MSRMTLCQRFSLTMRELNQSPLWHRETGRRTMRNVFSINILCKEGSTASLTATEMPSINAPLFCPDIGKNDLKAFSKLDIVKCLNKQVSIDVLIGLDEFWSFVKPGFVKA